MRNILSEDETDEKMRSRALLQIARIGFLSIARPARHKSFNAHAGSRMQSASQQLAAATSAARRRESPSVKLHIPPVGRVNVGELGAEVQ